MEHAVGCHEVLVEVACVGELPLGVVEQLVSDIHEPVDPVDVSEVRVGSKVVADVDLGLFRSGAVLAVSGSSIHLVDLQDIGDQSADVAIQPQRLQAGRGHGSPG